MASLYPALAAAISPPTVLSVALMSTLVGMVAPGLHSIFAETSFHIGGNDLTRDGLGFRVGAIDKRFQLVPITVAGPRLTGTVSAFLRAEPVAPPTAADAAVRVEPERFVGQVALVAGGSRGLGAVSAMLLAAGGASVAVTYRQGREDADRLVADINARAPRAKAMALDVLQDPGPQLADAGPFTHLYYFATPKVFRQSSEIFSAEVFDEFAAVYLKGFARVFAHVHRSGRSLSVLYPSSVAVETRPKGMTEYAMVKAAGEELCKDLGRQWPSVRFLAPRLPRILTDQTATVPPVPAENATDVMLPLLRQCA
jgi:NAD(P)-dependent dehydrogenase (short-subunit alcohol dehydrogenase family)